MEKELTLRDIPESYFEIFSKNDPKESPGGIGITSSVMGHDLDFA